MYEPDIEKLRRFSLVVALVLLTYSVAGISLSPEAAISVIGLIYFQGVAARFASYRVGFGIRIRNDAVLLLWVHA